MINLRLVIGSIQEVINNPVLFKQLTIEAANISLKEHKEAEGTSIASQSSGVVTGFFSSVLSYAVSSQKGKGYTTTQNFNERIKSVTLLVNDLDTSKSHIMDTFYYLAQEGSWNVTSTSNWPSFNTKFIRNFSILAVEAVAGVKEKLELESEKHELDLMTKKIHTSILLQNTKFPEMDPETDYDKNAKFNSKNCALMIMELFKNDPENFQKVLFQAAYDTLEEYRGFGIRQTSSYFERINNVETILQKLEKKREYSLEAFYDLMNEGNWNTSSLTEYTSFNTKMMRKLIQMASTVTESPVIQATSQDKAKVDVLAKAIYDDFVDISVISPVNELEKQAEHDELSQPFLTFSNKKQSSVFKLDKI